MVFFFRAPRISELYAYANRLYFDSEDFFWDPHESAARAFVMGEPYRKPYRRENTELNCWKPEPSPFFLAWCVWYLDLVDLHETIRTENQEMRNATRFWPYTDLFHACTYGHLDVAFTLLEKGASPNTRQIDGETPLHVAVYTKSEALVRMLLEAGADVDSEDRLGVSPLVRAVFGGSIPVVRMLLDFHANRNRSWYGKTCLDIAIKEGHGDIARLLWDAGARIRPADHQGRTLSPTRYRSTNDLFSLAKRIEKIEHENELDTDSQTSQRHPDVRRASDDTVIDYHTPDIADE